MRRLGRRTHRPEVIVYTRAGCGLCQRAEDLVRREARGCEVRIVDVDTDPDLQQRYTVRVPVVVVDGTEAAELEVGPGEVRLAVSRARRAHR